MQLNENGNIVGYTNTGVAYLPIIDENPLNKWQHVALVLSSGTSSLYLNGTQIGSSINNFSSIIPTSTIRIGSGYSGGRYFNGSIDDVSIFNYALTGEQIQTHFNTAASNPVPEPATMLLWADHFALSGVRIVPLTLGFTARF